MTDPGKPSYEELELLLNNALIENRKLSRLLGSKDRLLDTMRVNIGTQEQITRSLESDKRMQEWYTSLLLEHSPDILFALNREKQFALCSAAFLSQFGIESADFLRAREFLPVASRYFPMELRKALYGPIDLCLSGVRTAQRFSAVAGGRQYECVVQDLQSEDDAVSDGVLVQLHDITELTQAKETAEKASRAKTDFLATMSHEIRTPMNAIIGLQDAIMQEPLTMRQRNYFFNMKTSSKALMNIINDILDFSKIEAGKMTVDNDSFDLHAMLDALAEGTRLACEKKSLMFKYERDPSLPRFMLADENKLRQILNNLLSNATKYTPSGSVSMAARMEGGQALFSVQDTGIGIREEDKKNLFSPFEQFDQQKNKSVIGTGLGLAISVRLCSAMGGRLEVDSLYGIGSTFLVTLPFVEGAVKEDVTGGLEETFRAPGARVLVVDDVDVNLLVAEALMEMIGIKPDMAGGGHEALQLAAKTEYDIIFMDQMMPELDGLEATRLLREQGGHNAAVPIVALTANVMPTSATMFEDAGMNDFLSKPVEISQMRRCLMKWLPAALIEAGE